MIIQDVIKQTMIDGKFDDIDVQLSLEDSDEVDNLFMFKEQSREVLDTLYVPNTPFVGLNPPPRSSLVKLRSPKEDDEDEEQSNDQIKPLPDLTESNFAR